MFLKLYMICYKVQANSIKWHNFQVFPKKHFQALEINYQKKKSFMFTLVFSTSYLTWITIWSLNRVISPLSPSETCRLCVTCRGFSPAASLAQYFDGKYPSLPLHLPFHQSGSALSITVTLSFIYRISFKIIGSSITQIVSLYSLYSPLLDPIRLDVSTWSYKGRRISLLAVNVVASVICFKWEWMKRRGRKLDVKILLLKENQCLSGDTINLRETFLFPLNNWDKRKWFLNLKKALNFQLFSKMKIKNPRVFKCIKKSLPSHNEKWSLKCNFHIERLKR